MRPFVWAECAQHIHVNVLPGCFQISRANPKRLQLLKRGFVLETHWHRLFGSGVRQKGQFWRAWNAEAVHMEPRLRRLPHVMSVHRASLARRHVTSVHRASLARGRFPHVTSVRRTSLARGRVPKLFLRARGFMDTFGQTALCLFAVVLGLLGCHSTEGSFHFRGRYR